jgi:hypothetical protein
MAILSNGSTDMLTTLVRNTALDKILDATISIDSQRIFKPSPEAYSLVEARLGIAPADLRFIEPVGRDRSKVRRVQCRLDRTHYARGDGRGLPEGRSHPATNDVQGGSHANGRTRFDAGLSRARARGACPKIVVRARVGVASTG